MKKKDCTAKIKNGQGTAKKQPDRPEQTRFHGLSNGPGAHTANKNIYIVQAIALSI